MGRRLIEVMQVFVDQIHQDGYQHRVLEDSIREEKQKRVAAEKDRDHWKAARQDAIAAGELMQAEIDTLRQELSADAVRQELEELKAKNFALLERLATVENAAATHNETLRGAMAADDKRLRDAEERVWPGETRGCDAPDAMADEILYLRKQLDAARAETVEVRRRLAEEINRHNATHCEKIELFQKVEWANQHNAELIGERDAALATVDLQRAGIELLNAFVGKVRSVMDRQYDGVEFDDLSRALAELDAGNSSVTLTGSQAAEGGK